MRIRAPNNMVMDPEDPHLADEYVQEFVLDHFEDMNIKREIINNNDQETNQNLDALQRLPSIIPSIPLDNGHSLAIQGHLLTPPGSGAGVTHSPVFQNNMMHRGVVYPGAPGTPPDTPPGSESPPHHHYHPLEHPHIQQLPSRAQPFPDENNMMWTPAALRQEPLDLRPHCGDEWSLVHHNGGKYFHDEPRPLSVSSSSVMSPMSKSTSCPYTADIISDEQLIQLSVRELNKRLHGYPREQIAKLKAKRRTLKNRGYAQNCRSKRLYQRNELVSSNKFLHQELNHIKNLYNKLLNERNHYKKQYEEELEKKGVKISLTTRESETIYS